jgi:hypothetical protein
VLNLNADKGGYDTVLLDSVQGETAGRLNFRIFQACEKTLERQLPAKK